MAQDQDSSEFNQKLAIEYYKHIILNNPAIESDQAAKEKAYNEIAEELGLADGKIVKLYVECLKQNCFIKMRECVRLSKINGGDGSDAMKYSPDWLRLLEKHFDVLEITLAEKSSMDTRPLRGTVGTRETTRNTPVHVQNQTHHLKSSKPNAYQPRKCEISWQLLVIVRSTASCSESHKRASHELKSMTPIRNYITAVKLAVEESCQLHKKWCQFYNQSINKLMALIAAGDRSICISTSERLSLQEWHAVDSGLLFDMNLRVVTEESFKSSVTLYPLVLLFKLIIAAKKEVEQKNTASTKSKESHIGRQKEKSGARTGTKTELNNITENIATKFQVYKNKLGENEPNNFETAEIWALVYSNYKNGSRLYASLVLLQKRWYELKQQVHLREKFRKQFPYISTDESPSWWDLVKSKRVFLDSDLESPKIREYSEINLNINEESIFDELRDWSVYSVTINESITLSDTDDETINKETKKDKIYSKNNKQDNETKLNNMDDESTNKSKKEKVDPKYNKQKNKAKLNVDNKCIEQLERLDPTTSKVKILFEDDSVYDNVDSKGFKSNSNSNDDTKSLINNNIIRTKIHHNKTENLIQNVEEMNYESDNFSNLTNKPNDLNNAHIKSEVDLNDRNMALGIDTDSYYIIKDIKIDTIENDIFETYQNRYINDDNSFNNDNESLNSQVKVETSSFNDKVIERPNCTLFDEKLLKLSHVILTPIEYLYEWRKYSRNGFIRCKQFSVRNFSKPIVVTPKQLSRCRPYLSRKNVGENGGIDALNCKLLKPNSLKQKRNFLTRYLNLSRTYFSMEFWNERNIELLELCKPVFVNLKRSMRVVKKVELADIDEVRRINKTILTAEVAPITVHNTPIQSYSTGSLETTLTSLSVPCNRTYDSPKCDLSTTQNTEYVALDGSGQYFLGGERGVWEIKGVGLMDGPEDMDEGSDCWPMYSFSLPETDWENPTQSHAKGVSASHCAEEVMKDLSTITQDQLVELVVRDRLAKRPVPDQRLTDKRPT